MKLSRAQRKYLEQSRVARLGTVDEHGHPHVMPIVFANTSDTIYFVVDRKRKRSANLKRLRNISNNPKVTLLADDYSENWERLRFLMLDCKAEIMRAGQRKRERNTAKRLLKLKYMQYRIGSYFPKDEDTAVFVRLHPLRAVYWQNSRHSLA